jgi:transposase
VVTWRRAQMVLWPAQGMSVTQIAGLAFTSEDRVRDVLHNFSADGFASLYPRYAGGRPPVFTLVQRREIKKIAKSAPADHGLPFSRWSLAKLADFLVAEGVVEDISHEGLRELLVAEGVSFQAVKTWKHSSDPDYAAKKARVEHLYAIHRPRAGRGAAAAAAGHLPPHRRGPAPVRRPGAGQRHDVRAHQEAQAARGIPPVLPLPAQPAPGAGEDRDHLRQLQPAPDHPQGQARRPAGSRQQRGNRLHAGQLLVDEPHPR